MFPIALLALELGTWIGWIGSRVTSRSGTREFLINGTRAARSFSMLDNRLEKDTKDASKKERLAAIGVTKGIRFLASTKAFELVTLKIIHERWSAPKQRLRIHV